MRKRNIVLSFAALSVFGMSALTSPFTGTTPPAEGSATLYLYHVDTNQWLRENNTKGGSEDQVANLANVGKVGLDIEVIKIDGGYQLNPKMKGNHSINAKGLKMNSAATVPVTTWTFEPVSEEEAGVPNAYHIVAVNGNEYNETDYPRTLGVDKDNWLSTRDNDNVKGTTWQLVTPEERLQYMIENAGVDGADDATWLIPSQDFTKDNEREESWTLKYVAGPNGSNIALGGIPRAKVREAWNDPHGYVHYTTLTNLPNGTYEMRLQGYYREALTEIASNRYQKGQTPMQPKYFAGGAMNSFRHAGSELYPVDPTDTNKKPTDHNWTKPARLNQWFPDGLNAAAFIFTDHDKYENEWIKTVVTDGTLTLGVYKANSSDLDWTVYDNFQLRYISQETTGAEDEFNTMIENEVMPVFSELTEQSFYPYAKPAAVQNALEAVETAFSEGNLNATRIAYLDLVNALGVYLKRDVKTFRDLYAVAADEVEDPEQYLAAFEAAADRTAVTEAINSLRNARRLANAERLADTFAGNQPEQDKWYYLYNVGQGLFLQGGNNWGAQTSLGYTGTRLHLLDLTNEGYKIVTSLDNGAEPKMNGNVWMDTNDVGRFVFVPVEGQENVFYFKNKDGHFYVHAPYRDGKDATYVINSADDQTGNPDAMWKLVTEEDRIADMANATADNPVDVSFLISCPNFTRRERQQDWFISENGGGRNGDHGNLVFESWNKPSLEMHQEIAGLPEGAYQVTVQGYFRNGSHFDCPDYSLGEGLATFFAQEVAQPAEGTARIKGEPTSVEAPLVSIFDGDMLSPGEGDDTYNINGEYFNIPNSVTQAARFFELGLYKNSIAVQKDNEGTTLMIGVRKPQAEHGADWVVLDNFRLKYYGKDASTGIENVEAETEAAAAADAPVYNLQGIRVNDTTVPGIYIKNGNKFVVK